MLNATMDITDQYAAQNQDNIVIANLIVDPANNTVATNLTAVTFNITSATLNPSSITNFSLWNDTNANGKFDPGDQLVASIPGNTLNASFTNLDSDPDSFIPANTFGRFFLTMNVSGASDGDNYRLKVFAQNISIKEGTGDSADTTESLLLTIKKVEEDSPATTVVPGQTYLAYNITYYERTSDTDGAILEWLNITGWNNSVSNLANIDDIVNITVTNATTGVVLGYNDTFTAFPISIPLNEVVPDNSTYKLSIWVTVNTTGLVDGRNISFNATLKDNESMVVYTSDPDVETINVLDAVAHPTDAHAYEGQNLVVVGNITITPGVSTNLVAITFNATSATTLTADDISQFALWKDDNGDNVFDSGDTLIASISATDINASFTGLSVSVPATTRFFLTMNLSSDIPENRIYYQAEVLPRNIVVSNGTGASSTTGPFSIVAITTVNDSAKTYVKPGETYLAYIITYAENRNDPTGALLQWFNITGMSAGTITNIVNVTVRNATDGTLLGYSNSFSGFPISVNLSNLNPSAAIVPDNTTYKLAIYLTVASSVPDATQIAVNATLVTNETVNALVVNDPSPEIVSIPSIRIIAPSSVGIGSLTIPIKVVDAAGNPLQNSRVTISGLVPATTKLTGSNGIATFNVFVVYAGTINVKATYTNAERNTLTATASIRVAPSAGAGGGGYIVTPEETTTPEETITPVETATPVETTPTVTPVETTATPVETTATPAVTETTPEKPVPGFEAVFAIAGLLAVAYLLRRR
ncbi:PGF-CTERM sorting domain-containing protein [Archaeoglobus veneficus]|uniref:PGF-CTERM sorting domain-containing protein n=1 Tax=Archaeoglobus veneficus TaxID=58290 RepID=UPI001E34B49F|nr:PGF-CTERM sorting domain-containing protein [Archaeoglobus veneficus]